MLCLLILCSCHNRKTLSSEISQNLSSYPYTIDINEGLKNQTELKLSDIADSIKYIILSKEKAVAINFIFYIAITDSNIIASVSQSPFMRFDLNGKFLDFIGQFGRGPTEYLPGSKFAIDPVSKEIIVYRNFLHDYVSFDPDGKFIGKHPLKISNNIESFVCLSPSIFAFFQVYDGRELFSENVRKNMILLGLFSQNGTRLSVIDHPAKNIPSDFIPTRYIPGSPVDRNTYFNNEVVTPCYENTVYKINSDSIYTGFQIDWGNLPVPKTFEEKYYIQSGNNLFAQISGRFFETTTNAFFTLNNKGTNYVYEYSKVSNQSRSMPSQDGNKSGFINDIDGGPGFFPFWTNRKGDVWIDFIEAIDLKTQYTNDLNKESGTFIPANREKFLDLVRSIQPDDNPILRLVYLKK